MTKNRTSRRFTMLLFAGVLAVGSLLASVAGAAQSKKPTPILTGSITVTDQTWTCSGPVDLASVKVTITAKVADRTDAIHLRPGCTGRIGRLEVVQNNADAVKIADGVHDLSVDGGSIKCLAKAPDLHQDGVQALGGERITFRNMSINCGRAADRLIDSNFFVNQAGKATAPPADIVCDHCTLGGWTAHTVNLQDSVRSGLTNSTICVGRFPKLTMTVGDGAVNHVDSGNRVTTC